jgi:formyl-CoA transferase
MITDARFVTNDQRVAHRESFIAEVSDRTRRRDIRTWMELFNQAGIACGSIYAIDQVFADPQVQTYKMVRSVRHPRLGTIDLLGSPILMSESESAINRASPEKGEHTDEILHALGFTAAEIAGLRQERAAF